MIRNSIAFALAFAAMIIAPAAAQLSSTAATRSVLSPAAAATARVTITTAEGQIIVDLDIKRAPLTSANFLKYVDRKRFDGTSFYRSVQVPNVPEFGLVQGGVKFDPRRLLPPIAHEPTTKTGLSHLDGTISMARNAPGSAAGDFFFTLGAMSYMDADPTKPGDNAGYAAFGHVVEGMDVLRKILAAPISPTLGQGAMRGQMIAAPIRIITVRRTSPNGR